MKKKNLEKRIISEKKSKNRPIQKNRFWKKSLLGRLVRKKRDFFRVSFTPDWVPDLEISLNNGQKRPIPVVSWTYQ